MATTFTNNWKNILDELQSVLRTEFKNALPVYVGDDNKKVGSPYLRLDPVGTELLEYLVKGELREVSVDMSLYFGDKKDSRTALDAILRLTSRIEALIHDNVAMVLSDSTNLINCRIETTTLNAVEDSEFYIVLFNYKAQHMGNMG